MHLPTQSFVLNLMALLWTEDILHFALLPFHNPSLFVFTKSTHLGKQRGRTRSALLSKWWQEEERYLWPRAVALTEPKDNADAADGKSVCIRLRRP
jgi:hypothetical protein